jgi:hypothetical protein
LGLPRWARENELVQADAPSSPEPIAAEVLGAGR